MRSVRQEPLLRGKYRIVERIGAGSMATVFAGVHEGTDRPVAIKRLLPDKRGDAGAVLRFEREAKVAGRVRSEHVVEVLDVDREDDGSPFIVLERLYGESLFDRMRRESRLSPSLAIAIGRQILTACADLHEAGIVHRDLKPANVFLVERRSEVPLVKLVDFGVAKIDAGDFDPELTHADETLGTPTYMAPEQFDASAEVGPAADIWAAGVVIFRMLAGKHPFSAPDPASLVAAIKHHPPLRLADAGLPPDVALAVQPVLDRALDKDPKKRHASAAVMRAELESAARALGLDAAAGLPSERAHAEVHAKVPSDEAAGGADASDDAPTRELAGPNANAPRDLAARAGARAWSTARLLTAAALSMAMGTVAGWEATGALRGADRTHLAVVTTPVEATVSIDGAPVANPSRVPVALAGARARVSAEGREPMEIDLPARGGATLVVRLGRAAPPASSPQAPVVSAAPAAEGSSPEPVAIDEPGRAASRPVLEAGRPRRRAPAPPPPSAPKRPPVIPVAPY